MNIKIIAAVARDGTIGNQGGIPWSSSEDMKHFKEVTKGHTVIMGRKTWDSIPERFRPLPGRRNIVLSRDPLFVPAGAEVVNSLEAALSLSSNDAESIKWVIGGAELYKDALPFANELVITYLNHDFAGDTKFPLDFNAGDKALEEQGWEFVSHTDWDNYKSTVEQIDCTMGLDIYTRTKGAYND